MKDGFNLYIMRGLPGSIFLTFFEVISFVEWIIIELVESICTLESTLFYVLLDFALENEINETIKNYVLFVDIELLTKATKSFSRFGKKRFVALSSIAPWLSGHLIPTDN